MVRNIWYKYKENKLKRGEVHPSRIPKVYGIR